MGYFSYTSYRYCPERNGASSLPLLRFENNRNSKKMLMNTNLSIAVIAKKLTYDPSNFSKFFKNWTSQTPGQFRKEHKK
ncbi:helix-turn-helix domain-containing protein [Chryseobacterium ginsenosidimutans]|uniref:helix-turn-helix domain-containing protein n=1 Tax=Chryseobacterium ginsenosidimutans TaxID=687846 RepID=UPI003CD0B898